MHTYHDQIIGVMKCSTIVLRLQNVKFVMTPTVCTQNTSIHITVVTV